MYCQLTQDLSNESCSADLVMHEWQMQFNNAGIELDYILELMGRGFDYEFSVGCYADVNPF